LKEKGKVLEQDRPGLEGTSAREGQMRTLAIIKDMEANTEKEEKHFIKLKTRLLHSIVYYSHI
jgi:hypothetical protein